MSGGPKIQKNKLDDSAIAPTQMAVNKRKGSSQMPNTSTMMRKKMTNTSAIFAGYALTTLNVKRRAGLSK
jgi:hypothetical protein